MALARHQLHWMSCGNVSARGQMIMMVDSGTNNAFSLASVVAVFIAWSVGNIEACGACFDWMEL